MERILRAIIDNIPGLLEEMRPSQRQQDRFEKTKHMLPINSNALNCNWPLMNKSIQMFGAKLSAPTGIALRPATFSSDAGTDSHGPMDHPNQALTRNG